jgi:hypothetical protein
MTEETKGQRALRVLAETKRMLEESDTDIDLKLLQEAHDVMDDLLQALGRAQAEMWEARDELQRMRQDYAKKDT